MRTALIMTLLVSLMVTVARADEEYIVDQSSDINAIHDGKGDAGGIKLFGKGGLLGGAAKDDDTEQGTNVFNPELDNPLGKAPVLIEDLGASGASPGSSGRGNADVGGQAGFPATSGPVMNIRVRYTLVKSDKTPFLAHTAIHALHNYIVEHCPRGWVKLREWSLPVEDDWYLYYQFQCVAD